MDDSILINEGKHVTVHYDLNGEAWQRVLTDARVIMLHNAPLWIVGTGTIQTNARELTPWGKVLRMEYKP